MTKYIFITLSFVLFFFSCGDDAIVKTTNILENETISGSIVFSSNIACCEPKEVAIIHIDTVSQTVDTVASVQTNAANDYVFDNIEPGQENLYIVLVDDEGLIQGSDNIPDGDYEEQGDPYKRIGVYLDVDEHDDGNDFFIDVLVPNPSDGDITGKAVLDIDGDGQPDFPAIDQRIELYERTSDNVPMMPLLNAIYTDDNGHFSFEDVDAGEYVLYFIGDGSYNLLASYDEDQEAGEPSNSNLSFISVDLLTDDSIDSLNLFILQEINVACTLEPTIVEYWALCDTSKVCEFDNWPIVCLDQFGDPITTAGGVILEWTNLTTQETTIGDWIYTNTYDIFRLDITFPDSCSYVVYYNRDCEQDLSGQINLIQIFGDFGGVYNYNLGEVIWDFQPELQKVTITHELTSPASPSLVPPGTYDYYLAIEDGEPNLYLTSVSTGLLFLGKVHYSGSQIFLDTDITVDGSLSTFVKS